MLACAAIALAGCSENNAPASPPTPSEPLTTSSPTTVDTDVETVTATAQPPPDPVETTAAVDGPPEMPDEAREDSEAGAEAFALHYIDLINYTGMYPEVGLLEPLAAESCQSCANHEDGVKQRADDGHHLGEDLWRVKNVVALHQPQTSQALVRSDVEQVGQDLLDRDGDVVDSVAEGSGSLSFDLVYIDGWQIRELTLQQ